MSLSNKEIFNILFTWEELQDMENISNQELSRIITNFKQSNKEKKYGLNIINLQDFDECISKNIDEESFIKKSKNENDLCI